MKITLITTRPDYPGRRKVTLIVFPDYLSFLPLIF